MGHLARAGAVVPPLLVRCLVIAFLAVVWLLLSHTAASADSPEDQPGSGVADTVSETVAATRGVVDDNRPTADPPADVVRQGEQTGHRVTEQASRTVEAVTRVVDDAVDDVRDTAGETTRQVVEVVGNASGSSAPGQAVKPQTDEVRANASESARLTGSIRESLVAQENPDLLAVASASSPDLTEATVAASVAGADRLSNPVPVSPVPGDAPAGTPPALGAGQSVPVQAQVTSLGGAVAPADIDLPHDALGRALLPPAARATSPGTTPD